jgi:hypothetical protein
MTKSNNVDFNPRILSRSEAIAEGVIFDLAEIDKAKGLLIELGFTIPIAITYSAYAQPFDYREMLLALKSVLHFALYQGETIFRVRLTNSDQKYVWLAVLRELNGSHLGLTILTHDEADLHYNFQNN